MQRWYPRRGALLYLLALIVVCLLAAAAMQCTPSACLLPPSIASTDARTYAFVCLLGNLAFVYTNHVTTARAAWFRGAHGGFRDIAVLNAFLPAMVAVACIPWASALFPLPSPPDDATDSHLRFNWAQPVASAASALAAAVWRGDGTGVAPPARLLAATVAGLHITYLVRAGVCTRSVSAVDIAHASAAGMLGILLRVFLLAYFSGVHLLWLADQGRLAAAAPAYLAVVATVVAVSRAVRARYYFHFHHWFGAIFLAPASLSASPALSLVLFGICVGQLADGTARWTVAPLWHRYPWAGWGRSTI